MGTLVPGDWGPSQVQSHLKAYCRKLDRYINKRAAIFGTGRVLIPRRYEDVIPFTLVMGGVRDPDIILEMSEDIYNGRIAESVEFVKFEKHEKRTEKEASRWYRKYAIAEDDDYGGSML
jgi:hypothetical protein